MDARSDQPQDLAQDMPPSLPTGVARIILSDGVALALVAPDLLTSGLALEIGADRVPFTRDGAVPPADVLEFRPLFQDPLLRDAPEGGATALLNASAQWTLSGRQTVQVEFPNPANPARVTLAASIPLPAHDAPLTFRVYLASHRGGGDLVLRRIRQDGAGQQTVLQSEALAFDPDFAGGHEAASYAARDCVLPASDMPTELHLAIDYDGRGEEGDLPPVLFVADPRVEQNGTEQTGQDRLILSGDPVPGGVWVQAPLPGQANPEDPLFLVQMDDQDEGRHVLVPGRPRVLEILDDHGNSLRVSASEEAVYRVLVDGEFVGHSNLGPDGRWVNVPALYQTGHYRSLTITDLSGVHRLLQTYVLPRRLLTTMEILQSESRAPFPGPLAVQADHRYTALRAHMTAGSPPELLAQIGHALQVVEGGHDNVKLEPLCFPKVETPDVSVVIPAHNKVELTYLALASLLLAHNRTSFEVIVVDDGSDDETAGLEDIVSGITVIRNETPQRFIRACNAGVAAARGEFVALLNNDVEVTAGWLDELVTGFDRFDNVGAVGAKLLYPDGKLQDAGGIVWGNGNPWNYGNRANPWDPRFCYARQVDYLTGAALLTKKAIWDEVGGLSSYLEPMYFDDTDFSFKLREAGYSTWFIPSSVVYHFEGMTSGTDTASGFKRYQEINRPKFKRRWAKAYTGHGAEGVDPDLEKDRGIVGRVLFIDHGVPQPDRDAGSFAALQEIRLVQSLGYKVTFLPTNLSHMGVYVDDLEKTGVEVIRAPFARSVADYLAQHAAGFDAAYITRYYVADQVIDQIRAQAPQTKILFNNADLHFLRELRAGLVADDPKLLEKARKTRKKETAVMRKADVVLSYNDVEHAVIQSHTDGKVTVAKCPWVVDMPDTVAPLDGRAGISFLGNYRHTPNAEGVEWFAGHVMPLVEAEQPGLTFHIYGSSMPDEVKALEDGAIRAVGYVEDLADAYDRHRIFVAPLLSGAGIKGKVLAALARGVPCVLTPTAAEGIGVRHGHDCLIATTPAEWSTAITRLQTDDVLWQQMSDQARAYVAEHFSFQTGRALMRAAFESADLFSPIE